MARKKRERVADLIMDALDGKKWALRDSDDIDLVFRATANALSEPFGVCSISKTRRDGLMRLMQAACARITEKAPARGGKGGA